MTEELNGIRIEILWNKLVAIADEAAMALKRTSFSTVLRESNDFAVILLNRHGDSLCHGSLSVPTFSGIAGWTVKHLLAEKGEDWFADGDAVITNNPWLAAGHKPDVITITPIYHDGRHVGFVGSSGHVADIGGIGQSPGGHDMYEEGLGIPPVKFLTAAGYNADVIDIIRDNVRIPDEVIGDINAQVSAGRLAARRICELLSEEGLEGLEELGVELMGRAEDSMRKAIREIPNGSYHYETAIDGFEEPVVVAVTVEVRDEEVCLDFSGTSPTSSRGINCVRNYTVSLAAYTLKCVIDPMTPKNEGAFRPFKEMRVPEGCILNPAPPVPTFGRSLVGHVVTSAIFGALAQAIPDRVLADSGSCPGIRPSFLGRHNGRTFSFVLFENGGMGARATRDGLACTGFPTNADCASIEVMESIVPLYCHRQELRQDSGGPGRMRGGLGLEMAVEFVSDDPGMLNMMSERKYHPALGLFGGRPGLPSDAKLNADDAPQKSRASLKRGDVLTMSYPGGGGYGDPTTRDRGLVRRDIEFGYVSREAALRDYGYDPEDGETA